MRAPRVVCCVRASSLLRASYYTDGSVHSVTLPRTVLAVPSRFPGQPCPFRLTPRTQTVQRARACVRTPHGPPLPRTSGGPCAPRSTALCSLFALLSSSLSLADYLVTLLIASPSRPHSCIHSRRLLPIHSRFYFRERVRQTRPSPPPPSSACLLCPSRPVLLQHSPLYLSLTETPARWFPLAPETPP